MRRLVVWLALLLPGVVTAQTPNFISPSNAPLGTYSSLVALEALYPSSALPSTGGPTAYITGTGPYFWNGSSWVQFSTGGSSGTVTAVSVVTANGLKGTVATSTTTPAITLAPNFTGIGYSDGSGFAAAIAANFPTLNQNTTGTASGNSLTDSSTTPIYTIGGTGAAPTITLTTQSANFIFSGPASGAAAQPNFRALVALDIPLLTATQMPAFTGDVATSSGSTATTIAAGAVTLAKQANLAANSIQGNNTGSPATPIALTTTQTKALLAIANTDVSGLGTASTVNTGTSGATIPLLSGALIFSGATDTFQGQIISTKTGSSAGSAIYVQAAAPTYAWQATGQATDAKLWDWGVNALVLCARTINDAQTTGKNGLCVTRSANVITDISIGNATDNPTVHVLGTGALTVNGAQVASAAGTGIGLSAGTVSSNAESTLNFVYDATAILNAVGNFTKIVKVSTVDNVTLSASALTCSGNPTVELLECSTSTTCASPTVMASGTITTTGTATLPTVSSSAIAAGDYVAWEVSAGTCTVAILYGNAQIHSN